MATYQVFKETALPGTLTANAIYLITHPTNTSYLEIYVTNSAGSATRRIPTESDIQSLIDSAVANLSSLEVVADIAERDGLTLTTNTQVLVLDATADSTVQSGAATYVWDNANTTWRKLSEAESLDVVLDWNNIINGPSSSASAIDTAVTNSHTHANKTQLDNIGEDDDGKFSYNGTTFVENGSFNW